MNLSEKKFLLAYSNVLENAIVYARTLAWRKASFEQIGDLLDAIHNIPELLRDWYKCDQSLLRSALVEYDKEWKKVESDFSLIRILDSYLNVQFIQSDEELIEGKDVSVQERIIFLIRECLNKVAQSEDGKTSLYQSKIDKRYWELYSLSGGKLHLPPFGFRYIDTMKAIKKYNLHQ